MLSPYAEILRTHSRPLEPIPTGRVPVLAGLSGIRAVLFDLYGTLFVSGSGEVGTSREAAGEEAFAEAIKAVGVRALGRVGQEVHCLFDTIEAFHAEGRKAGRDYPEVQIVEVWRAVLAELARRSVVDASTVENAVENTVENADPKRLAVEYEARANPVWPMPGLRECLETLRTRGVAMGILSNAQFYTPELFPALLGQRAEAFGFDPHLQYYSYRHGWGKPSLRLFELARAALRDRGIEPAAVLLVGNDMLNDIYPAWRVGFRTALFAGDARSLRLRADEPRVEGVSPDVVLTELGQLLECMIE
jgi:putative hydrolase of the HAD superfamily